jgi:hypothetical protein
MGDLFIFFLFLVSSWIGCLYVDKTRIYEAGGAPRAALEGYRMSLMVVFLIVEAGFKKVREALPGRRARARGRMGGGGGRG